ncbi:glycosyltransferase family 4 protein [Crassaminicella indica]|uniref:Glycosyltransferase family 4 protein n=1 Tax=Crassaminicella indica TaxID=2855394 RepID=A0ABX8RFK9_9CLOT|nr:glycosyltransferase family 4 protein [Crassaminicella indica]QXM06680.1 glycosyltransferase family 4 protein [Crassaminicella indica]
MKKIVFFIPFGMETPGGAERVLATIANALSNKSYNIKIITFNQEKSFYKLNDNVQIISLGLSKSKNYVYRKIQPLLYMGKFRKIIKKISPNVIITLGIDGVIFKMIALLFFNRKIKKIAWEHNSYFQPTYKILNFLRTFVYKYLDKVFVLNTTDGQVYKKLFGEEKICIMPNPVPWESTKVSNLSERVIVAVGRYQDVKGFDFLIKAFKDVVNTCPEWKLKIFGKDEGDKEKLSNLVRKLRLEENVELNDVKSDIKEAYLNSSIYVMSSKFECFPMVLLEAKECGLPIVSFDCPSGPRDLVEDGEDGYLARYLDIDDLSKKIKKLTTDQETRIKFGKKAKVNVEKYKLKEIEKKWVREI